MVISIGVTRNDRERIKTLFDVCKDPVAEKLFFGRLKANFNSEEKELIEDYLQKVYERQMDEQTYNLFYRASEENFRYIIEQQTKALFKRTQ